MSYCKPNCAGGRETSRKLLAASFGYLWSNSGEGGGRGAAGEGGAGPDNRDNLEHDEH